jgi:mRNA interferase MazF
VIVGGDRAQAVLADQVKSLDWGAGKATRKGQVSSSELADVRAKIGALIGIPKVRS